MSVVSSVGFLVSFGYSGCCIILLSAVRHVVVFVFAGLLLVVFAGFVFLCYLVAVTFVVWVLLLFCLLVWCFVNCFFVLFVVFICFVC